MGWSLVSVCHARRVSAVAWAFRHVRGSSCELRVLNLADILGVQLGGLWGVTLIVALGGGLPALPGWCSVVVIHGTGPQ